MRFILHDSRLLIISCLITSTLILFTGCKRDKTQLYHGDQITLKWHQSYNDDDFEKAITGLNWALSQIGVEERISDTWISYETETITIAPDDLAFSQQSAETLKKLHRAIQESLAYHSQGYTDIGHYVALLLGSSEHYYQLVNLPKQLSELQNQYALNPSIGYISTSAISQEHRELRFSDQNGLSQLFISQEIDSITGEILEFETLDLLPNGQARFGVYDPSGNRIAGAIPGVSSAGKPGKCMWCHESTIQPLFWSQVLKPGYLTPSELSDTLIYFRNELTTKQNTLGSGVDFTNFSGHVSMELLYISYMEPSAARLAREWNMSESEILSLLSGLPTHEHAEFTFLGELYDRKDLESIAPYTPLSVSSSVRERIGVEVNWLD